MVCVKPVWPWNLHLLLLKLIEARCLGPGAADAATASRGVARAEALGAAQRSAVGSLELERRRAVGVLGVARRGDGDERAWDLQGG